MQALAVSKGQEGKGLAPSQDRAKVQWEDREAWWQEPPEGEGLEAQVHVGPGDGRSYPQRRERIYFFFPPDTAKKDAGVAGKSLSEGRGRTQAVYAQEPTVSQGEAIYSERQQPAG